MRDTKPKPSISAKYFKGKYNAAGRCLAALLHYRSAGRPASACRFSLVGKTGCPADKLKGQNEAEAVVVAAEARAAVGPVRHPAVPGTAPEAAPAKHATAT